MPFSQVTCEDLSSACLVPHVLIMKEAGVPSCAALEGGPELPTPSQRCRGIKLPDPSFLGNRRLISAEGRLTP